MRKRIVATAPADAGRAEPEWLDLEPLAQVEVTSEEPAAPIESALRPGGGPGWRASGPGAQTLRLLFDAPQPLRRIRLHFLERAAARTQEFVLRWSADGGRSFRDLVRQQWTFSPAGATAEMEDYEVDLGGVDVLELTIVPDISGGPAAASLASWRVA
jgi:hypothetical protein